MYPNKAKFQYGGLTPHQTALGNIDLDSRAMHITPPVKGHEWFNDPFGHPTIKTEESATINEGLGFVNIPTIIDGVDYKKGQDISDAVMHYKLTGQHLGKFGPDGSSKPWTEADKAANDVHLRQQDKYVKDSNQEWLEADLSKIKGSK